MTASDPAGLVEFDEGQALERAKDVAGDRLQVCAVYTADDFELLYVADDLLEYYDDESEVLEVGEALHGYMDLDFNEREVFEELYPAATEMKAFVTYTDHVIVVRVLSPETEGLYVSLEPGTEVTPVVNVMAPIVHETG